MRAKIRQELIVEGNLTSHINNNVDGFRKERGIPYRPRNRGGRPSNASKAAAKAAAEAAAGV